MKYKDLLEFKKRIEFNLTEPEVLIRLIEDANQKGEKVQSDLRRLRKLSSSILSWLKKNSFIYDSSALNKVKPKFTCTCGIDGSFYPIGGVGGKWYVPISVVRVIFEEGINSSPNIDIYWAGIEEIFSEDKPNFEASIKMLSGETKAIFSWATSRKEGYVFIDGPIVDPPKIRREIKKEYVKDRCESIIKCLETSIVIGCVKRSRDEFLINYLKNTIEDEKIKAKLDDFPTDQHLLAYVFSSLRRGYGGALFTHWIDISSVNDLYKTYKENGVYIICLFFQKSVKSQILRLDIPLLEDPSQTSVEKINEKVLEIVKVVDEWTYPSHDYPLPVLLAHEKCSIREGCARVLYEEIITKGKGSHDIQDLIILDWLR